MKLVIVLLLIKSFMCNEGIVDWCALQCQDGGTHTMCKYKPETAIKTCTNIVDVQTPSGRKIILHLHNEYRNRIANGKMKGWPKAANMRQMSWDHYSEAVALRWAQQCVDGHDKCRRTRRFPYVGQNWGLEGSDQEYLSSNGSFDGWVVEIDLISDPNSMVKNFEGGKWGHFTQVVWASSYRIGCGEIHALEKKLKKTFINCNYGPAGNRVKNPIYSAGEPCTKCPNGTACRPKSTYPNLCAKPTDDTIPVDIQTVDITKSKPEEEDSEVDDKKMDTIEERGLGHPSDKAASKTCHYSVPEEYFFFILILGLLLKFTGF